MSAWKIFHSQFNMEGTTSEHSCQVVQNDDARLALLKGEQRRGGKGAGVQPGFHFLAMLLGTKLHLCLI